MITGRVGCSLASGHEASWLFVVGRAFLAAVPAATSQAIVDRLSAIVAQDAIDVETVVALLPLSGAEAIPSFVVIVPESSGPEPADDSDGVGVSAVIRGEIVADMYSVGGSRRFSDRDIRPWLLADFQSVIGIAIGDPAGPVLPEDRLRGGSPLDAGIIAGQALHWSRNVGADAAIDPDATLSKAAAYASSTEAALRHQIQAVHTVTGIPLADTVLRSNVRMPASDADTVITTPRLTPLLVHGTAVAEEDSEPTPATGFFRFTLHSKRSGHDKHFLLAAPCVLGRHPRSPRVSHGVIPRLITVDSPTSAVSGTHLEIRQLGDAVVVTDLGSTNGTRVTASSGNTQRLSPGSSLVVLPGARVDIGDGNIIEILPVGI